MATTPKRRIRTGGYYADPSSPIASTPQRSRRTGFAPSRDIPEAPLSPMKMPHPMVAPRDGASKEEEEEGGWRGRIFSPVFQPVLKLVGLDGGDSPSAAGAYAPTSPDVARSSPHSTLSRSDGTRSSGGSSVPLCSLGSPSLYGRGAHTPTPPRRQPSPITTPTTPPGPGVPEDAPSSAVSSASYRVSSATATSYTSPGGHRHVHMHTETHSSTVVSQNDGHGNVALAAADDSWEADVDVDGTDDMDDVEYDDFDPYLFIKLLPSYEDVVPKPRRIVLPKKSRSAPRVSLVLDLDETLVHCSIEPIPDADLTFKVAFNGQDYEVFVRKRPFLGHFLEQVSKMFEVTVFTASQSVYAQKLLDLIDPRGRLVEHRLFREACLNVDGNYLKDLTVLGRDLRHTVLVDNSPHAFGYQVDNGIPIESWFEDPADTELLKLLQFLKTIQHSKDVRPHVRRKFRMWDLINAA